MILTIGHKRIGDGEPTFIMAEAGINHNRDINLAKRLIKEAKKVGVDAIKFQIFQVEEFCSQKSEYYDLFKSLEFNKDEWNFLAEYARDQQIIFTASVFGKTSADLLDEIRAPVFKIASADLTYFPLLSYIASKQKPIILSTGMATIEEIREAIKRITLKKNKQIALLHCISNYPTKYHETNLRVIETLKKTFNLPVGFSDHTIGTVVPIAAVALGANIIEKHFTLDRTLPGPDQKLSLEPHELRQIVEGIRIVELSIGDEIKTITPDEEKMRLLARRSLVAKKDIPKGTTITEDMIKIVRPGTGIPPKHLSDVIGKVTKQKIQEDEVIPWEAI